MCVNQMLELKQFADAASDEKIANKTSRMQFRMMYEQLEGIQADFRKQHQSILTLMASMDKAIDEEEAVRKDFEFSASYVYAVYQTIFEADLETSQIKTDPSITDNKPNLRLPKVEIPKFSGDLKAFKPFYDMFKSIVHENDRLSNVEKFNYLVSSLEGPASALVQCTPLTGNNYQTALDALVTRYDRPRLVAFAHLQSIDNAPVITNIRNVTSLRNLVDIFNENLAALNNMGFPTDDWDFLLFYIFSKHLGDDILAKFEVDSGEDRTLIPTFESLKKFVVKLCNALETVEFSSPSKASKFQCPKSSARHNQTSFSPSHRTNKTSAFFTKARSLSCALCKNDHSLYSCPTFFQMSPHERLTCAKTQNWCTNCLSNRHFSRACKSKSTCRSCNARHHSLLHFDNPSGPFSRDATVTEPIVANNRQDNGAPTAVVDNKSFLPTSQEVNTFLSKNPPALSDVLLSTAIVEILDRVGNRHRVRVLMDSGSQVSYISSKCFKKLKLPRLNIPLTIQGLDEMEQVTTLGAVTCTIAPVGELTKSFDLDAFILPKICSHMPSKFIDHRSWEHISRLNLADPQFFEPGNVDLLLGADVFPRILLNRCLPGAQHEPYAMETVFGWILMGKYTHDSPDRVASTLFTASSNSGDPCLFSLNETLKRFWEVEDIPEQKCSSPDDELCEKIFMDTHRRDESGRYIVNLPFKDVEPHFDTRNSRLIATRRLHALENRLLKNQDLKNTYSSIIREYLELKYLELVSPADPEKDNCYFVPHHCVVKPEKTRIVYDASAKTQQGFSLNDHLLIGEKLQKDIVFILMNFRVHNVVFTCDIKSMFTQIKVAEKHQDFLRILWRFDSTQPIREYRMNRVIFGLACAPFLANRTILQLAMDEAEPNPLGSEILKNDIYVDDIVTGFDSVESATIAKNQLRQILKRGGFELRKWTSNRSELLSDLSPSHIQNQSINFDSESNIIKILGMQWLPNSDIFTFRVETIHRKYTKRHVLSDIARIYDPLGFLTPVTVFAKCLMQSLWTQGLGWDDELPLPIRQKWIQFQTELPLISTLRIQRRFQINNDSSCELHGFCDASTKAYACAIYFRSFHDGNFHTSFVIAKSKLAPLKQISLPRLELMAAVLLADLISVVLTSLKNRIRFTRIRAWSDSSICITWVKSQPYKWKTFVSNRVSHIQQLVAPDLWYHVSSQNNPSDPASRGLLPSEFLNDDRWMKGPHWLSLPENSWPHSKFKFEHPIPDISFEQKKSSFVTLISEDTLNELINRYSSFSKLQRVLGYMLRFIFNLQNPVTRKLNSLSQSELNHASLTLYRYVQSCYFADEITALSNKKPLSKTLRKLGAYLDEHGLLRVGGRLQNSQLNCDQKHPLILPRKARLTSLIIEHFHRVYLHPGVQTLHFLLAQQFWILSPRRAIRTVVSKCHSCWRLNPKPFQPPMGNLPKLRISQIKAFSCVGVDYAGPFLTTLGKYRGAKSRKTYICVFVCFATKALHFELASDLSTETFLCAFRRFISRRGRCSKLYSDCGSNFIGAHKQILHMFKNAADTENIEWHFNPPSAPHFSGLVEA